MFTLFVLRAAPSEFPKQTRTLPELPVVVTQLPPLSLQIISSPRRGTAVITTQSCVR